MPDCKPVGKARWGFDVEASFKKLLRAILSRSPAFMPFFISRLSVTFFLWMDNQQAGRALTRRRGHDGELAAALPAPGLQVCAAAGRGPAVCGLNRRQGVACAGLT
jgi:hypothetical protein